MKINTIGIIGAGVMGSGVAQNFAQTGYQVILVDISEEILDKTKDSIMQNIKLYTMFNRDVKLDDPKVILNRIKFTTDYQLLHDADFVVENVNEKWTVKEKVYQQIDKICPEHCIFAANTSAVSITRIAALTTRPTKLIGIHFMNPVPMKKTVEIIRGYHTSEETIEITKNLLQELGKESILVNDFPGFVSNRISHLFMNEAAFVVQDGVATPAQVDEIFKKCYNHKMGPLETADLIGLDTVVDTLDILFESYNDPKFRCCPLLRKMVDAGLYGRKNGEGFFKYNI